MTHIRLDLNSKKYNNLIRNNDRMSSKNQLRCTLRDLELREFHVRCHQKYIVKREMRRQIVIKHFLFCNSWQVRMTRRFVSEFCLQTNVTFNTNYLNLSLTIIVEISNIDKIFSIVYCYIIFEFKETMTFIFESLKKLMFYDCINSRVVISDFVLEMSIVLIKMRQINYAKTRIETRLKMLQIDVFDIDVQLQLCFWHAIETIRKRVNRANSYSQDIQKKLHHLLWN